MQILKNKRGQTDSVFKLALVVIIIAAVLAVVAYMMSSTWGGAENIASGAATAADSSVDDIDCMVSGDCSGTGPSNT